MSENTEARGAQEALAAHGLQRKTPLPGWANRAAEFDARSFGVDAWPAAVWQHELSQGFATYVAYVESGVSTAGLPTIAALGGVSHGVEAEILTIAVAASRRRSGLGSLLLEDLISVAREHDAEVIFLEVRAKDLQTQAFYGRHGFEGVGRRRRYYVDDDALIMRRDLRPEN